MAPIHCRGFIGEAVMQLWISPNLLWWGNTLIYILDCLMVSKLLFLCELFLKWYFHMFICLFFGNVWQLMLNVWCFLPDFFFVFFFTDFIQCLLVNCRGKFKPSLNWILNGHRSSFVLKSNTHKYTQLLDNDSVYRGRQEKWTVQDRRTHIVHHSTLHQSASSVPLGTAWPPLAAVKTITFHLVWHFCPSGPCPHCCRFLPVLLYHVHKVSVAPLTEVFGAQWDEGGVVHVSHAANASSSGPLLLLLLQHLTQRGLAVCQRLLQMRA